jgi:hypothetical protein
MLQCPGQVSLLRCQHSQSTRPGSRGVGAAWCSQACTLKQCYRRQQAPINLLLKLPSRQLANHPLLIFTAHACPCLVRLTRPMLAPSLMQEKGGPRELTIPVHPSRLTGSSMPLLPGHMQARRAMPCHPKQAPAGARSPRPPSAVKDDVRAVNLAAVRKRVLELLPRAVPGQVVHHHLRGGGGNSPKVWVQAAPGQPRSISAASSSVAPELAVGLHGEPLSASPQHHLLLGPGVWVTNADRRL